MTIDKVVDEPTTIDRVPTTQYRRESFIQKIYQYSSRIFLTALAVGTMAVLGGCDRQKGIANTNAYLLLVNPDATYIQQVLPAFPRTDYTIIHEDRNWNASVQAEFKPDKYGILVVGGHHLTGTNYLYGDAHVPFDKLPKNNNIEAVLLSACTTAGTDQEVITNVYRPLMRRYPNLKVIVGYENSAPISDGIIPRILKKKSNRKLLRRGKFQEFVNTVLNLPHEVRFYDPGIAVKMSDGNWMYYSKDNPNGKPLRM